MKIGFRLVPKPAWVVSGGAVQLDSVRKEALETARKRLIATAALFGLCFAVVGLRLIDLATSPPGLEYRLARTGAGGIDASRGPVVGRSDLVDRNGVLLATSLPTTSVYADPSEVIDPNAAAGALAMALPDMDENALAASIAGSGRFVWIRRNLTPREHERVLRIGVPGIHFRQGERRVYPHGRLATHVLGLTDVDGHGTAGVERHLDDRLRGAADPIALSLDIRIQAVVRDALSAAVVRFKALGGAALVLDAQSGEVLSLVSLPDFDPHAGKNVAGEKVAEQAGFNRVTKGVYEMGSTFKLFTAAMAFDSGVATLKNRYDAREPLRVARFTIRDYHPENRWLTVPEILVHSSNIGAAKLALDVGGERQRHYLSGFGLLDRATLEIPEIGRPLVPSPWRDINTMTIAYGHGVAVSPLQLSSAVAALVNGGVLRPATLLRQAGVRAEGDRVIAPATSDRMRNLMRLVVKKGTGRRADVPGYLVGGKTGTAEKARNGGYNQRALMSSFVAAFPLDRPRAVVFVMLDEPKGDKKTFGYATGGWVAAPVVKQIISRVAPMMAVAPRREGPPIGVDGKLLIRAGTSVPSDEALRLVAN